MLFRILMRFLLVLDSLLQKRNWTPKHVIIKHATIWRNAITSYIGFCSIIVDMQDIHIGHSLKHGYVYTKIVIIIFILIYTNAVDQYSYLESTFNK